jgi:hypothetical protein
VRFDADWQSGSAPYCGRHRRTTGPAQPGWRVRFGPRGAHAGSPASAAGYVLADGDLDTKEKAESASTVSGRRAG